MQIMIKSLLEDLNIYVKAIQENSENAKRFSDLFRENYISLKEDQQLDGFYESLRSEFSSDPKLLTLVLSIIYGVVRDDRSLYEIFYLLQHSDMNLLSQIYIRDQLETCIFRNSNLSRHYRNRRSLHKQLLTKLENLIDVNLDYKPYKFRNKNRIVITTGQLLGDFHAPTYVLKEICYILQNKFHYEVLLIVSIDDMYDEALSQIWYNPLLLFYNRDYDGSFTIEYKGEKINGFQFIMNHRNLVIAKKLINIIYNYNPMFIWHMGNPCLFADLFRKYTTVMAMPFTDGYAISEAQIMCAYLNSQSDEIKDMEAYFREVGQKSLQYGLRLPLTPSMKTYRRIDFNMGDEDFAITVVGNRLDTEVNNEFKQLLREIMQIDSRIYIVFIGKFESYPSFRNEDELFATRTRFLGYQEDLIGILGIMDLFLNPPRQGGGAGAVYSLYNGVPVVTLNYCDVANSLEPEDTCDSIQEMFDLIQKYFYDQEFYQKQSMKALEIRKKRGLDVFFDNTKAMLEEAVKLLE